MSKIDEIMEEMEKTAPETGHYGDSEVFWLAHIRDILERHLSDLDPDAKLRELRDWLKASTTIGYEPIYRKIESMLEETEEPESLPQKSALEDRVAELEGKIERRLQHLERLVVVAFLEHFDELEAAVNQHAVLLNAHNTELRLTISEREYQDAKRVGGAK